MEQPLLRISNLCIGYKNGNSRTKVAGPINTSMQAGELICLLGPNGAGKSTLIRTIAGLQSAFDGSISIGTEKISHLKPTQLAKRLSVVLTDQVKLANLDAHSLITLGRYPYSGWLGTLNAEDIKIVDWAIASTHVESFLDRKMSQLSDGECQKIMLARALAQDTDLIILDEPTAHLDLPSRIEMMRLLHKLAKETNKAILVSTHELDLALQVADKIWLLKKDGNLETGLPESLVMNGTFEQAFEKTGVLFDKETGTFNIHEPGNITISVSGDSAASFWTKRALIRNGFNISDQLPSASIEVLSNAWILHSEGTQVEFSSLEEALTALKTALRI